MFGCFGGFRRGGFSTAAPKIKTKSYIDGTVEHGEFQFGKLKVGSRSYSDGTVEEGTFEKGKLKKGKRKTKFGDVHEGTFKDGKLEGNGTQEGENGSLDVGTFERGVLRVGKRSIPGYGVLQGIFDGSVFQAGTITYAYGMTRTYMAGAQQILETEGLSPDTLATSNESIDELGLIAPGTSIKGLGLCIQGLKTERSREESLSENKTKDLITKSLESLTRPYVLGGKMDQERELEPQHYKDIYTTQQTRPVVILGGFPGHAITYVVFKNKVYVCNTGSGREADNLGKSFVMYKEFTQSDLIEKLRAFNELAKGADSSGFLDGFETLTEYPGVRKNVQRSGNCWYRSTLVATELVMMLCRPEGLSTQDVHEIYKERLGKTQRVLDGFDALVEKLPDEVELEPGLTYRGSRNEDGKPEGLGVLKMADGSEFRGTFRAGKYHNGELRKGDGHRYRGRFGEDGRLIKGRHILPTGDTRVIGGEVEGSGGVTSGIVAMGGAGGES